MRGSSKQEELSQSLFSLLIDDCDQEIENGRTALQERYKPFARNDEYGIAGMHYERHTSIYHMLSISCCVFLKIALISLGLFLYAVIISFSIVLTFFTFRSYTLLYRSTTLGSRFLLYIMGFKFSVQLERKNQLLSHYAYQDQDDTQCVLVSNHVSYIDMLILLAYFSPRFVAKESVREIPFFGRVAIILRVLFVPHPSSSKSSGGSSSLISQIRILAEERQKHKEYIQPIAIFPEGTTTNGSYILPFKTGAFAAGVPVQPIILKYQTAENEFNPSWESIRISTHFLRMLCQRSYKCTILVLSKIDPQKPFVSAIEKLEYVKSSRIIESEERKKLEGEVKLMAKEFACTVRDKMAKAGDLSMSNSTYQDKYQYHAALQQLGY